MATRGVSLMVGRIGALGLRVAPGPLYCPGNTEALLFHGPLRSPHSGTFIVVNSVLVAIQAQMKYMSRAGAENGLDVVITTVP